MPEQSPKACVILLGMGGPSSLADIRRFLINIFSDRSIIRLPGGALLQKPFAHMIAALRTKKVQAHYDMIGGSSPLLKWTESQLGHIEKLMRPEIAKFRGYVGMRYFHPLTEVAVRQAYDDGYRVMYFLPMYPQYCRATTGSSFEAVSRALRGLGGVTPIFIKDFHDHPGYITLLREYIDRHIQPDETLLFSAHSIPQKFVDEGDPYVDQVRRTAALAAGKRVYHVSFQSRTGPVNWVGPDTVGESKRLLGEGHRLFIVPISFVCDHIETLYEIDIELPEILRRQGVEPSIRRMPMFNDDPRFGEALADLVRERMVTHAR